MRPIRGGCSPPSGAPRARTRRCGSRWSTRARTAWAMSSLGYQQIYRRINEPWPTSAPSARSCPTTSSAPAPRGAAATYESRPAGRRASRWSRSRSPTSSRSPGWSGARARRDPAPGRGPRPGATRCVLAGGPLTFSNPLPLAPFVDAIVVGEAEDAVHRRCSTSLRRRAARDAVARALAGRPGCFVPAVARRPGARRSPSADDALPARAGRDPDPDTELSDMFLVEAERGCYRRCTYCVMRRSTNGGMRIVAGRADPGLDPRRRPPRRPGRRGGERPPEDRRDGATALVGSGRGVGSRRCAPTARRRASSRLLRAAGYRTLTVASDGGQPAAARRDRAQGPERHLLKAARLAARARAHQMLKVYMMLGVPEETDEDIDELVGSAPSWRRSIPRIASASRPFVAKRNTPLDGSPSPASKWSRGGPAQRLRAGLRRQGRGAGHQRALGLGRVHARPGRARAGAARCSTPSGPAAGSRTTGARSRRGARRRPGRGRGCRRRAS